MKQVMIAGATGYLGRHLCAEYQKNGWHVSALVRNAGSAADLRADQVIIAEATQPATLQGKFNGMDLVVSALGITRQTDGLSYWDVDYQANLNLLTEALAAEVPQFAYVHVLNAEQMPKVPLAAAKSAFVAKLRAAQIRSTVIAPSGYFSDMDDFLNMARKGRVWLFGDGLLQINPIHGADLAEAIREAVDDKVEWLNVGGPDLFTHKALAQLAFEALDKPAKITCLPDGIRRALLRLLPWVTPRHVAGPAQFFLTAFGLNMVGMPVGDHRLSTHFQNLEGR